MHGLDFDIEVTGFEMGEIDFRIASLEDPSEADADTADVLPKPQPVRHSANRETCGSSARIASCAAALSTSRPSPH